MSNEITQFKYEQLDGETADFLRQKESNMRQIVGKAYTELGRELKEAQDRLAKHGYGCFEEWYTALGFKRQSVYNYIHRYTFLQQLENQKDIESFEELPAPLQYAVSNPKAESTPAKAQAKAEVLAGDIGSLKEYRERIKDLERKAAQAEQRANVEQQAREQLEEQVDELTELERQARQEAETARAELERAMDKPYGVKLGLAMYDALEALSDWQKEYSWIITDTTEFRKMVEAEPNFAREFSRLDKFWKQMSDVFHSTRNKGTYTEENMRADVIDVEFTEVI